MVLILHDWSTRGVCLIKLTFFGGGVFLADKVGTRTLGHNFVVRDE